MTRDSSALFNLYLDRGFFSPAECVELLRDLSAAPAVPATVHGRGTPSVDERVRKVSRLTPCATTLALVTRQLLAARERVALHFGVPLTTCEEPQFLLYREGDFFVAHQDGNTPLLRSALEQSRKVSVVIFLNDQADSVAPGSYGGGLLRFTEWRADRPRGQHDLAGQAGCFVAFASDTTHEVTPVIRGERYTIVSWYG